MIIIINKISEIVPQLMTFGSVLLLEENQEFFCTLYKIFATQLLLQFLFIYDLDNLPNQTKKVNLREMIKAKI